MARVLIAGESWTTTSIHVKGFDSFTTVEYQEGVASLRSALVAAGHEVTYMPNHVAAEEFPYAAAGLDRFDVVVLSDIGSNTLLVPPAAFRAGEATPNRLAAVRDWTLDGGGLVMIGGYLSFQGIEAKANYRTTPLAQVLPVELEIGDDRVECPEEPVPRLEVDDHPITVGLEWTWPRLLGYQRVTPKPEALVLATINDDPLLVVGEAGLGRSVAFTSDIGPHWAPAEFVEWKGYALLWGQAVAWVAAGPGRAIVEAAVPEAPTADAR